jgi:hypothetical protein
MVVLHLGVAVEIRKRKIGAANQEEAVRVLADHQSRSRTIRRRLGLITLSPSSILPEVP